MRSLHSSHRDVGDVESKSTSKYDVLLVAGETVPRQHRPLGTVVITVNPVTVFRRAV